MFHFNQRARFQLHGAGQTHHVPAGPSLGDIIGLPQALDGRLLLLVLLLPAAADMSWFGEMDVLLGSGGGGPSSSNGVSSLDCANCCAAECTARVMDDERDKRPPPPPAAACAGCVPVRECEFERDSPVPLMQGIGGGGKMTES